jgi:hypothetical protein
LLLATGNEGRTVFLMAVQVCKLEVFQRLFNLAKHYLIREEVNKVSLATDNEGRTVFHLAAQVCKL